MSEATLIMFLAWLPEYELNKDSSYRYSEEHGGKTRKSQPHTNDRQLRDAGWKKLSSPGKNTPIGYPIWYNFIYNLNR